VSASPRPGRPFQVLVLGTGSHVGKSLLAAGLCRILADRGWRTAPYKAQNMALNSAVADDGGEIGRAQWLQAAAARVRSDVRMNPVLLKPVRGRGSQLVLMGRARGVFSTRAYFRRWPAAARAAQAAWRSLALQHEALVLEGAGSPAEVNLSRRDLANLEAARFSRAPFVLVADAERGGSFAAVVGTLQLLPAWLRRRCLGVVFNKFRGDASLMDPGLAWLARRGVRTLGVLPWMDALVLEEEDSLGVPAPERRPEGASSPAARRRGERALVVDVLRLRSLSNFNDVLPLQGLPGLRLRWVEPGSRRTPADLVILPGSKDTLADLARLRASGEDRVLRDLWLGGAWLLGICGGMQMLGTSVEDPSGVDSGGGPAKAAGLAFLDLSTRMSPRKVLARRELRVRCSLGTLDLKGYEIHHGRSRLGAGARLEAATQRGAPLLVSGGGGRAWGSYLHGLLDLPGFRNALLEGVARARAKAWSAPAGSLDARREESLDRWARHLERHLDLGFLPSARERA